VFQTKHFHVKHSADPWYITGFAEGCASFTYSRSGGVVALYFGIKVSIKDQAILQAVQAFFDGIGRIYRSRASSKPVVKAAPDFLYFRVNRARELGQLVGHFDRYPLTGAKAQQYQTWREMVRIKQRFRRPDIQRLAALASQLSGATRRTDAQG
jgi:LAGLIDADG endonuclease